MANTFTQIYIQLIFAVQDRSSLIQTKWKDELYKYITGIIQTNKHKLIAINGIPNHIHVFIGYKPHQLIPICFRTLKVLPQNGLIRKDLLKENSDRAMALFHFHILK